ncbi:MAG: hypothetical protein J6I72_07275 [Muribaculaceae bacterium]|nr:hypothetical protein [Muribaculaceae bacterium]
MLGRCILAALLLGLAFAVVLGRYILAALLLGLTSPLQSSQGVFETQVVEVFLHSAFWFWAINKPMPNVNIRATIINFFFLSTILSFYDYSLFKFNRKK